MNATSVPGPEALDASAVLGCGERARLHGRVRRGKSEPAADLASLVDRFDAFILDGYGVINIGPEPIPGIVDAVRTLRAAGRQVMVLTNGAGLPARHVARRYAGWGLDFADGHVASSRDALEMELTTRPRQGVWGVMARPGSELRTLAVNTVLLEDDEAIYRDAAGFIFLSSVTWSAARHERLTEAMRASRRPLLVANPDISAPYPDGRFSAEPGYWALRLESEAGIPCEGYGKPFVPAFELALSRLGRVAERRERVAMVGDGLYTDILGGLAAGLGTVLVTGHGLLKDLDWQAWVARTEISPDYVIPGP